MVKKPSACSFFHEATQTFSPKKFHSVRSPSGAPCTTFRIFSNASIRWASSSTNTYYASIAFINQAPKFNPVETQPGDNLILVKLVQGCPLLSEGEQLLKPVGGGKNGHAVSSCTRAAIRLQHPSQRVLAGQLRVSLSSNDFPGSLPLSTGQLGHVFTRATITERFNSLEQWAWLCFAIFVTQMINPGKRHSSIRGNVELSGSTWTELTEGWFKTYSFQQGGVVLFHCS